MNNACAAGITARTLFYMPNYKVLEDVAIDNTPYSKDVVVALEESVADKYVEAGYLALEADKPTPAAAKTLQVGQDVFYQAADKLLRGKITKVHENGNADVLVSYDKETVAEKNDVAQGNEYGQWRL